MDIEAKKRKLAFRAWHRGTREADMLLGPFADHFLPTCSPAQLEAFAALLEENDPDLYDWVSGRATPPEEKPLLANLIAFIESRQV